MTSLPKYANIYKLICWNCRNSHEVVLKDGEVVRRPVTLHNVKDQFGFKTNNYVCRRCKNVAGTPPTEDSSRVLVRAAEEPKQWKSEPASSVVGL